MSHVPGPRFMLVIELPMWADSTNETITSGPHTDFQGAAFRLGPILHKLAGWYLKDSKVRIIEQGGECRIWTRNRHGEYVQDTPVRSPQLDHNMQLMLGGA